MDAYDWLATHYKWMYEGDYEAAQREEVDWLETELNRERLTRVLDASCGDGFHAIPLSLSGFDVVGSDISEAMVAQARLQSRAAGINIPLHVHDLLALDQCFRPGSFDAVVVMGHTLSHLLSEQDLLAAIRQMKTVLRHKGLAFVDLPEWDADNDVLEYSDGWVEQEGPVRELFFSVREYQDPVVYLHCFHLTRNDHHTRTKHATIPMRVWDADWLVGAFADAGFVLTAKANSSYGKGTRYALALEG